MPSHGAYIGRARWCTDAHAVEPRVSGHAFSGIESVDEWPNVKVCPMASPFGLEADCSSVGLLGVDSTLLGAACRSSWHADSMIVSPAVFRSGLSEVPIDII